jgi:hypothetical protein
MKQKYEKFTSQPRSKSFLKVGVIILLFILNKHTLLEFSGNQIIAGLATIFLTIYLTSLKEIVQRFTAALVFFSLTILSFLLQISQTQRWSLTLLFSVYLISVNYKNQSRKTLLLNGVNSIRVYLLIISIYTALASYQLNAIQFLTYGYDNAFHISILKAFQATSWYSFLEPSRWSSDFELFQNYPAGQAALFSFMSEVFVTEATEPTNLVLAYATLLVCLFLGIVFLSRMLIQDQNHGFQNVIVWFAAVTLTITFVGPVLVNGFTPYLLSLFLLLIWANNVDVEEPTMKSTYVSGIFGLSLYLVSPLVFLIYVFPFSYSIYRGVKTYFESHQYPRMAREFLFLSTLSVMAVWINHETSSKFGWRQLIAFGGVQPPNIVLVFILMAFFIWILFLKSTTRIRSAQKMLAIGGTLTSLGLTLFTYALTDSVQYYALKQIWIGMVFVTIFIISILFKKAKSDIHRYAGYLLIMLVFIFSLPTSQNTSRAFMGVFWPALQENIDSNKWNENMVDIRIQKESLGRIPKSLSTECIVMRILGYESDLNSRWANVFSSKMSTSKDCFSGYWNSHNYSNVELMENLSRIPIKFVVVMREEEPKLKVPTNVALIEY